MLKRRSGPIRVLVVEDSPTTREVLVALFNQARDMQVVGTALDGEDAIRQAARLRPDVITMDIHMPRMDGLEATRKIMKITPTPIVIVTASTNRQDMDLTFQAMRVGALTVVKKPSLDDEAACAAVVQTVRLMADVPVVRRFGKTAPLPALNEFGMPGQALKPPPATPSTTPAPPSRTVPPAAPVRPAAPPPQTPGGVRLPSTAELRKGRAVIGIASSTGGPSALATALKPLPADYPLPILVVQHITNGFAAHLCEWLGGELKLQVHLARQDEVPQPGHVLIAPDGSHMQVSDRGAILLHSSPPYKGLRPSANYLFYSLARVYGSRAAGVILTGMGDDGVEGLLELHNQGGLTIAQDEETSVVFGMPREAILRKAIDHVMAIDHMGFALMQLPFLPVTPKVG